jgi:sugar lactone lactonase YvrE
MIKLLTSIRASSILFLILIVITACNDDSNVSNKPVTWTVTTLAGNGPGLENGNSLNAKFNFPIGLALTSDNELLIADFGNNLIRKLNSANMVSTEAGTGMHGLYNGPVDLAQFDQPYGIAISDDGAFYITDQATAKIRKIANGLVSTFAGGVGGNANGPASQAGFTDPSGIAVSNDGSIFIADRYNNSIRKITKDGNVTTYAGSETSVSGYKDGYRKDALFDQPMDICAGGDGTLFIVEYDNNVVRKISPDGTVSTVAGNGKIGFVDGIGTEAEFSYPSGIAVSSDGTLYVADEGNNRIRQISKSGQVTTIAGSTMGNADGKGSEAKFFGPLDIIIAADGSLIVADSNNHRICKITSND